MKSRTLAEKKRERAVGDYSVSVDRSGTFASAQQLTQPPSITNTSPGAYGILYRRWNLNGSRKPISTRILIENNNNGKKGMDMAAT